MQAKIHSGSETGVFICIQTDPRFIRGNLFNLVGSQKNYSYLLALLLLRFDYGASFILKSYRLALALVQYTSVILPCISSKT